MECLSYCEMNMYKTRVSKNLMQKKNKTHLSQIKIQTHQISQNRCDTTTPICSASIEDAVSLIRAIAQDTKIETRYIDESDGHTLGAPVLCRYDIPGFDRSTKDGFAVCAADTEEASPQHPIRLTFSGSIQNGYSPSQSLTRGTCMAIATGGALPDCSDAVVMHEYAHQNGLCVEISCPVSPGDNIIKRDEDAQAGKILFPEGWILRPQDIGVLAGFGICTVQVRAMPVIGILSTGPELVPADGRPARGEVRETNSYLISALCRKLGAMPKRYGIAWEGTADLSNMLLTAVSECDAIIISGGSAHDERDRTAEVISHHGSILLSGLSISPRKKMVIGAIDEKPIIGLPGHPASVYLLLLLVVSNLIQAMKGSVSQGLLKETAIAGVDLKAHPDREYHIPVRIDKDQVFPLSRKAGLVSLLTHCDGIVHIPQGSRGVRKGEMLEVMDLTRIRSPFHVQPHNG